MGGDRVGAAGPRVAAGRSAPLLQLLSAGPGHTVLLSPLGSARQSLGCPQEAPTPGGSPRPPPQRALRETLLDERTGARPLFPAGSPVTAGTPQPLNNF